MKAAPFMVASYSNPGPRKHPGGTNRAADANHMSINPLRALARFDFTRGSSLYLYLLPTRPEQEQDVPLILCCADLAGLPGCFFLPFFTKQVKC